ncbi:YkgJ family cysteine cluster protein [Chitinophaga sedimenti]|uniref:YkgJ family cysteine cluster protein n=1 Tax=Chitinophaga sedimenti TaxID=2033606 RepID=UPI00200396A3|nr:YkgJ family cysteine cluster protein [Chitinophaga sedimenti]MCK7556461.1 YkgJ family cysteine cluster protein [Chitinophaga sedimenti]
MIKDVAVTCKKGCSFCCHMDIDITSTEAQLIKEYMAVNAIGIDAGYLEAQLSLSKVDRPLSQTHSACVFLKGENCLIYPVRPIACRKHLMNSAAVFCDQKLMVGSGVGKTQVLSPDIEALHSAIEDALKEESGRMAGILLRELDIV